MSELLPDDLPDSVRVTSVNEVMAAMSSGPLLTVCMGLGVVADTSAAVIGSLGEALRDHGLPALPGDELRRCVGPPIRACLAGLVDDLLGDPDDVDRILAAYRRHYRHTSLRLATRVPGIREALNALDVWARAGVVSSEPVEYAVPVVDAVGLRKQIAFVEGPQRDDAGEAAGGTLDRALERWGRGDAVVVVADHRADLVAGRDAGAVTVAVTWGAGTDEELREADADHRVTTPGELPDLLRTIRAGLGPPPERG